LPVQAWEIFEQVRLDADLVTLSACNTGLGQELKGEGLIGLTRAFSVRGGALGAGIVVERGRLPDHAVDERFYAELKQGKSKDAALRAAQLELAHSQSSSSPCYWAGFSLSGDWR
jgi:CHAT domain-containing protein